METRSKSTFAFILLHPVFESSSENQEKSELDKGGKASVVGEEQ